MIKASEKQWIILIILCMCAADIYCLCGYILDIFCFLKGHITLNANSCKYIMGKLIAIFSTGILIGIYICWLIIIITERK